MYAAIWAYPWDLEEDSDAALTQIAEAGLNAVSVSVVCDQVSVLCPHHPRRAIHSEAGGSLYFRPEPGAFEGDKLQPIECVSQDVPAEDDPLSRICEAAARHDLAVHARTVLYHNTRLGAVFADCCMENAFGDRYPFALCPAHPDVRAYTLGLVRSLAARSGLNTIEIEAFGYVGIGDAVSSWVQGMHLDELHRFLLSICFCEHCRTHMETYDVDVGSAREAIRKEMRGVFAGRYVVGSDDPIGALSSEILGQQNADGIFAARDEVVLSLLEEIYWLVHEPQTLSVLVSGSPLSAGMATGVTLSQARSWTDRFLVPAFDDEIASIRKSVTDVAVRRGSTPVFAGLKAFAPSVRSSDQLAAHVAAAAQSGAEGVQFFHYGQMPIENLDWIRQALAAV